MYGQGFEVCFLEYFKRKVNGFVALVYEDYEDEMSFPETWFSSRNVALGAD